MLDNVSPQKDSLRIREPSSKSVGQSTGIIGVKACPRWYNILSQWPPGLMESKRAWTQKGWYGNAVGALLQREHERFGHWKSFRMIGMFWAPSLSVAAWNKYRISQLRTCYTHREWHDCLFWLAGNITCMSTTWCFDVRTYLSLALGVGGRCSFKFRHWNINHS